MKKFWISIICLLLGFTLAYQAGNWMLARSTSAVLSTAPSLGRELGLRISDLQIEGSQISGVRSLSWEGLSFKAEIISANTISRPGAAYYVTAKYFGATLLGTKRVLIEADGLFVDPIVGAPDAMKLSDVSLADEDVHGRVAMSNFQFVIDVDSLLSPKKELRKLVDQLQSLLTSGETDLGMTVDGRLTFFLGGKPRRAKLLTDSEKGKWVFRLDPGDLKAVSLYFEEPLSEHEIKHLVRHPFRVAELMEIRDSVKTQCAQQREKDRKYPEQAHRHVLWSYLLSQKFGAEFSKSLLENFQKDQEHSEAQHAMNFSNHRVGREWAQASLKEDELLERVRKSEEVIRLAVE